MPLIPRFVEGGVNWVLDQLVTFFIRARLRPNVISTIGFLVSLGAALVISDGNFVAAGVLILLSGILDMMDGKVARQTGRETSFGAVYDSTLDRLSELALYAGIALYCMNRDLYVTSLLVLIATIASLLVSYVRARAEALGISCTTGIMRRGERIVLLGSGALFNFTAPSFHNLAQQIISLLDLKIKYAFPPMPLTVALAAIAVLSSVTVVQRLAYIKRQTAA
jgi:CDP-diacylglycerol--glycerol-3-phosphate 3-phosphatidyltransferase